MDKPGRSPTVREGSKAKPRTLRDLGASAADDKCNVHGTILKLMKVPVRYGSQARDEELWEEPVIKKLPTLRVIYKLRARCGRSNRPLKRIRPHEDQTSKQE